MRKKTHDPLERALVALGDDRAADALEALIDAWGRTPSPELAACIESASALARTSPSDLRGRTKIAIAAWSKLARSPTAADVPALLESLADVLWRDARARLVLVATWRWDPRVDELLVKLLETLPYGSKSKPLYKAVIALAGRICDPLLIDRIEQAKIRTLEIRFGELGEWIQGALEELVRELRAQVVPGTKPSSTVAAIRDALATARSKQPVEAGELLQSIYDRPDDTARRLVYADALLDQGDARGELITLQCQDALTAVQRRRESALLKKHGRAWLGELAPIIRPGFRFERGFLAACSVDPKKRTRIAPLVGHPAWSTVHTLADSALIALHPIMRALRTLEFQPNHARYHEDLDDSWRELLAGAERPIERLYFADVDRDTDSDQQVPLLARCDALPSLRELYLGGGFEMDIDALACGPVATQLQTLGFIFDAREVPPAMFRGGMRESRIPRIVVRHEEMTLRLERGATGYERAWFEVDADTMQACNVLSALPPTIRELRIETARDLDRGVFDELSAIARTLPLDVREIGPPTGEPKPGRPRETLAVIFAESGSDA